MRAWAELAARLKEEERKKREAERLREEKARQAAAAAAALKELLVAWLFDVKFSCNINFRKHLLQLKITMQHYHFLPNFM